MDREIIDKLVSGISPDSIILFFRQKTRTLKVQNKQVPHYTNTDFVDFNLIAEFKTTDDELYFVVAMVRVANELSERSSKKLQYELGKRYLKDNHSYSGGFFVFYDAKGDFRFSFIHEIHHSKGELTYSNFKRYTYFVSKSQTNKTFIQQLQEAQFTSLDSIIEAFSVEKVTRQFYQEIATWYFWAMDKIRFPDDYRYSDDPTKDAEIRNSTNLIRLLTRIIFIWFLKEKKLVPDNLFDGNALKNLVVDFYSDDQSANYYNAILQNLFFGTLNQPMNERQFIAEGDYVQNKKEYGVKNLYRYASKFKVDTSQATLLFKDIPFLNGGLFDCLDKEDESGKVIYIDGFSRNPSKQAIIPDYLFFQTDEQKVNLTAYEMGRDRTVRGLIEILRSYNFTVDESTPIDQEIALDPELLGKVFEELLASYNPETATTARKATGSFYTPREIVDYMVRQSMVHYFKTHTKLDELTLEVLLSYDEVSPSLTVEQRKKLDKQRKKLIELIDNIKILDPACGSGAFPMGILHQLVMLLQKLDPENKHWYEIQYNKALAETQQAFKHSDKTEREELLKQINEAFDQSINFPDYARKLYLIENCIYGIDIQPIAVQISKLRFFISLVLDQKIDSTKENYGIRPLPNLETKFVAANTLISIQKPNHLFYKEEIKNVENEIKHLRHEYFQAKTRKEKLDYQNKDKILRKQLAEELSKIGYSTESSEKIAKFNLFDPNASADWFDPEWMFGVTDGFDIVIGNPPYIQLQKDGGKLAKIYEKQNYQTFARTGDIYTLFYEKGLQLLNPNAILCYITSNKWMRAGYGEKLRAFFTQYNPLLLIDLGPGVFENATVDTNILLVQKATNQNQLRALTLQKTDRQSIEQQVVQNSVTLPKLNKDAWFIGSDAEQQLKEKIERIGKPLKDWDVKIYRGVLTGLNEAFIITSEQRNQILANCQDEAERKRTEAIIKPILRGRDIKRYYYEWAGLWVIGTFPALRLNIDEYPALKKYFLDNFDIRQLEQSGKKYPELGFDARKKTGNKWFETQDQIAYYPEFEKEKIFFKAVGRNLTFAKVEPGIMVTAPASFLTGNNLNYILGFLCSSFTDYYVEQTSDKTGAGDIMLNVQSFERIMIPPITPQNEGIVQQIEALVDKILAAKKHASAGSASNPQADTSEWEREIDRLVYELYGLTEEEVKIIEKQ